MTTYSNGFEGHADEDVVLTSNSASSGFAWSSVINSVGGSTKADTARAAHGATSLRIDCVSGSANYVVKTVPATFSLAARKYIYLTALPTADESLVWFGIGGTRVCNLLINAAGALRARDAASVDNWTASATFPLNQWVRVELWAKPDATTAGNGDLAGAYFLADSATAIGSFSVTNANLGTAGLTDTRFGKATTTIYAVTHWIDDVFIDDAAVALPGSYSVAPAAIVRPSAVASNPGGWAATGAADLVVATADESDGSYMSTAAAGAVVVLNFPPITSGDRHVPLRMDVAEAGQTATVKVRMLTAGSPVGPGQTFTITDTIGDFQYDLTPAEMAVAAGSSGFQLELTGNST